MKLKIKKIFNMNGVVFCEFENIIEEHKNNILDVFKEDNIFFKLRFELYIIHTMRFSGNVLEIISLNEHSEQVTREIRDYFSE